jgi:hypothetical protein
MTDFIVKSLFQNGENKFHDVVIICKDNELVYSHNWLLINSYGFFEAIYELMDKEILSIKYDLTQFSKKSVCIILNMSYGNDYDIKEENLDILLELLRLHDFLCSKTTICDIRINLIIQDIIKNFDFYDVINKMNNINCKYFNIIFDSIFLTNSISLNIEFIKYNISGQISKLSELSKEQIDYIANKLLNNYNGNNFGNLNKICIKNNLGIYIYEKKNKPEGYGRSYKSNDKICFICTEMKMGTKPELDEFIASYN